MFYINGSYVGFDNNPEAFDFTNSTFAIGVDKDGSTLSNYFSGLIYEVSTWKSVLSSGEISSLYKAMTYGIIGVISSFLHSVATIVASNSLKTSIINHLNSILTANSSEYFL